MFEKVIAVAGIDLKVFNIPSTKSFFFLMLDLAMDLSHIILLNLLIFYLILCIINCFVS